MTDPGCFVLVVGPSGAGKDTLIAGAKAALAGDARFVFSERLITREALPEAEAHGTISRAEFLRITETGDCALSWEAHGLGYVVPLAAAEAVAQGKVVICNGSRGIVAEALRRYPQTRVILVDAHPLIRAVRLAARGRETGEDIALRLAREIPRLSAHVPVTAVDNSGSVAEGIAAFVAVLQSIAGNKDRERTRA